jgi:hypothetical protein
VDTKGIVQSSTVTLGGNTIATDAEAEAGANEVKTINSKQLKEVIKTAFVSDTLTISSTQTIVYAHTLGKIPTLVDARAMLDDNWTSDST